MHMHWEDPMYTCPSNEAPCPFGGGHDSNNTPPLSAGYASGSATPFLMVTGRWLEQMGFGVGATVRLEAIGPRLVIEAVARSTEPQPRVPTRLHREVHYAEVEAHSHPRRHPWSDV
jgi:hypothetical protein